MDINTSVLTSFSFKEFTIISALEMEIIGLTNNSTINRKICVARLQTVGDWQYLNPLELNEPIALYSIKVSLAMPLSTIGGWKKASDV